MTKKIGLLVLFVFMYVLGKSQAISQRGTSAVTVQDARLFTQYNFRPPVFPDTTSANAQIGLDSCGALIFSRDINAYYYRACSPKRWVAVSGGGSANAWELVGNSNAVAGTNFLGTINNIPLEFRVKNIKSGIIDSNYRNTALGYASQRFSLATPGTDSALNNTSMGFRALGANVYGDANTAIGYAANALGTNLEANTTIGYGAEAQSRTSSYDVAIGWGALARNFYGYRNTAVGADIANWFAPGVGDTMTYNTMIGFASAKQKYSGRYNVFIGDSTGALNLIGSKNVFIGSKAGKLETGSDKLYIANDSTLNPLIKGDFASSILNVNGKMSISTTSQTPDSTLDVTGGVYFRNNLKVDTSIQVGTYTKNAAVTSKINTDGLISAKEGFYIADPTSSAQFSGGLPVGFIKNSFNGNFNGSMRVQAGFNVADFYNLTTNSTTNSSGLGSLTINPILDNYFQSGGQRNALSFLPSISALSPNSITYNQINIRPTYNQGSLGSGILRGIYYNPNITSLNTSNHIALETTSGKVILKGLKTSSSTSDSIAIFINDTLSKAPYPSVTGFVPYTGATSNLNMGTKNVTANAYFNGFTSMIAAGTTVTLTVDSTPVHLVSGSGGQTFKLPVATTLSNGTIFSFNNNQSSGTISVNNNSNTLVKSVPSGAYLTLELTDNTTAVGSWDAHFQAPSNVAWSTNTLDYAGSITNATWNGNVVAYNRGGTGSSSTFNQGGIVYGSSTTTLATNTAGTSGQVLASAGTGVPTWTNPNTLLTAYQLLGSTQRGITLTVPDNKILNITASLADGSIRLVPVYIPVATTITGIRWYQGNAPTFNADNYNGVGLYTHSAGTLNLVASSTNDTSTWKQGAQAWQNKAFSTPYSASEGVYYIAALYNTSLEVTAPQIGAGTALPANGVTPMSFTNGNKLVATLVGATLTTPITMTSTTATNLMYGLLLY